jgi:hypothetical protein
LRASRSAAGSHCFGYRIALSPGSLKQKQCARVISVSFQTEEMRMRKTLAVLATVAAIGATAMTAPPAEARGFGPGLAFGLAAGALAAGAYGAYGPYA